MKPSRFLIFIPLIFAAAISARPACAQEDMYILTGDVLIEYEDLLSPNAAARALKSAGLRHVKALDAPNLFSCRMPADIAEDLDPEKIASFLDELRSLAAVRHAEADYIVFVTPAAVPDDQYFLPTGEFPLGQWSLMSSEPYSINADAVWDRARGEGKIIAILDNGFTSVHSDLTNIAWIYDVVDHPVPPDPSLGDKHYLDLRKQYAHERYLMEPTGDWQNYDTDYENEYYHGLACSGVAAASMNNSAYGIVGVAPEAEVGMIRISATYSEILQKYNAEDEVWYDVGPVGYPYGFRWGIRYLNVIEGIHRAVPALTRPDLCARVINMSWGQKAAPPFIQDVNDGELLQRAIDTARSFHCVFVASTGNDGEEIVTAPARIDNVIAVGSSQRDGHVRTDSNYGYQIDCVAPGDSIIVTMPIHPSPIDYVAQRYGVVRHINYQNNSFIDRDGKFSLQAGTSFAAAHVSGAVAVLQSYLIESEAHIIEHLLLSTTRATLDPSRDGQGLIDLAAAIDKATVQNFQAALIDSPAVTGLAKAHQGEDPYIELTWDAYTEFEFDSYDIWRRIDGGAWRYYDFVNDSVTEYHDTGITPGHEYYYEVRARIAPYGRPGHLPPGLPLWMNVSICGRSEPDTIDYQGSGSGDAGRYTESAGNDPDQVPDRLSLEPNYPNPFNPSTTIRFGLPDPARARLLIMNIRGETVRVLVDRQLEAGWHVVTWDGRNESGREVASGIYLYLIEIGGRRILRKMTLVR